MEREHGEIFARLAAIQARFEGEAVVLLERWRREYGDCDRTRNIEQQLNEAVDRCRSRIASEKAKIVDDWWK